MKNIYKQLLVHLEQGTRTTLATVVDTNGSAPQVPGSSAVWGESGLLHGTIGGGAVEAETGRLAIDPATKSGIYSFNLANSISEKEKPVCGGTISILLDVNPGHNISVFKQVAESLNLQNGGVLVTRFIRDAAIPVLRYWITGTADELPADIRSEAGEIISGMLSGVDIAGCHMIKLRDNSDLFLEPVSPSPRLIIAGAGHIGRSLAHIADFSGFNVTVIDDRAEYANRMNIPEAENIVAGDIGQTLRDMHLSSDSYIVIVTRGHKDDADALRACISSNAAYIGMIGSRRKTSAMKEEFLENGWATEEQWSRIYTPVGLDINSRTVEEIAVSIAAELIMVKNTRKGKRYSCPA